MRGILSLRTSFPPENKTLILSMAKTRLGLIPTVPFDDIIDRKGQGLNILLEYVGKLIMYYIDASVLTHPSGPPGIGKTFTVEATSEYFKLPLYSVQANYSTECGLANFLRYPQASLLSTTEIPMRLSNNLKLYSRLLNTSKLCSS